MTTGRINQVACAVKPCPPAEDSCSTRSMAQNAVSEGRSPGAIEPISRLVLRTPTRWTQRETTGATLPKQRRGGPRHGAMTSISSASDVTCSLHIMSWVRVPCTVVCPMGHVRRTDVNYCVLERKQRVCCIVMHVSHFFFAPTPTSTLKSIAPRAPGVVPWRHCTTSAMPSQ